MTDNIVPSLQELLTQEFIKSYKSITAIYDKITEILAINEGKAILMQAEKEEEERNIVAGDIEKYFDPFDKDYDRSMVVDINNCRLISARKLLQDRIDDLQEKKEKITMDKILQTHVVPYNHSWKPMIQVIDQLEVFEGNHRDSNFVIDIPINQRSSKRLYDFRLEVEGVFDDTQLDMISIEINNQRFDTYRRIIYDKPKYLKYKKDLCHIPLDFWMKDIDRSINELSMHNCEIHITNVPSDVNIKLVLKKLSIDNEFNKHFMFKPDCQKVTLHEEKIINAGLDGLVGFTKYKNDKIDEAIEKYGFMTMNKEKIYDIIESIDGISIFTLCGTQKLDLDDTIIWFDLITPIKKNMLFIKLKRKVQVPVRLIFKKCNFILISYGNMLLRYVC